VATPYVTPDIIANAPTGVPWNIIPFPKATSEQQLAEQTNICWRATGRVDSFCNQPLRATLDTEDTYGPDYRLTIGQDGVARALVSRVPIVSVPAVRCSARSSFPRQWQVLPAGAAQPESPPLGVYNTTTFGSAGDINNAILIQPGYISWAGGRNGYIVELTYLNGWPHAGLLTAPVAGATTFRVDDVTAWTGAAGFIYDGANTEQIKVTSVVADNPVTVPGGVSIPVGPGTVTLATATTEAHPVGVVMSAIPPVIQWATIMYCAALVLESGASAVTIQSLPGSRSSGGTGIEQIIKDIEGDPATHKQGILQPFCRVI